MVFKVDDWNKIVESIVINCLYGKSWWILFKFFVAFRFEINFLNSYYKNMILESFIKKTPSFVRNSFNTVKLRGSDTVFHMHVEC